MSNNVNIAISGKSGCGNTTVSKLLAERLGYSLVNYTFRTMAEEMNISFNELRILAEKSDEYDRALDKKQIELAQQGNTVLGSRLAVWLCTDAVLKVYLYGSPEERSRRVFEREGGEYDIRLKETLQRDNADQTRYNKIYNINTDDYNHVDLIINTEYFSPGQEVDIIISALKTKRIIS